jgi:hypothetical protein
LPFSFIVSTTGTPKPSLTEKGELPKGFKFTHNGDGTATIAGETGARKAGVYPLTFTATFGSGRTKYVVIQTFTLTVAPE